jgi:hypothetical protein
MQPEISLEDSTPVERGWSDYFWSWFPDDEAAKYEVGDVWLPWAVSASSRELIAVANLLVSDGYRRDLIGVDFNNVVAVQGCPFCHLYEPR